MLMKSYTFAIALVCSIVAFGNAHAQQSQFSIVGQWEGKDSNDCPYRLAFTESGEIFVESGLERLAGTYTIEALSGMNPVAWVVRVIKQTNGMPDCNGQVVSYTETPQGAFVFVSDERSMVLCFDAQGQSCFGKFVRR
jgi:hypothetical protein